MAHYAAHPSHLHYHALKNIAQYLHLTKDWGIIYCCPQPLSAFPSVLLPKPSGESAELPPFPDDDWLHAYLDAAHGTNLLTY